MPKNPKGEVNTNNWYPTRPYSISIAAGDFQPADVANIIHHWSLDRRSQGKCFLAGQVSEVLVATPVSVVKAIAVNGEINPEHATYCSDNSAQRLVYRLTKLLMESLSTDRAWIRYNGSSMAVTKNWLDQYFIDNPSSP